MHLSISVSLYRTQPHPILLILIIYQPVLKAHFRGRFFQILGCSAQCRKINRGTNVLNQQRRK